MSEEKKVQIPSDLQRQALAAMRVRESWGGEGAGSPADEYIEHITAAGKFYVAGDIEAAIFKIGLCLELQQKRLAEGRVVAGDATLFSLAMDAGIADREEGDHLRQLLVANKISYYEQF
jgi:hypothetical protein